MLFATFCTNSNYRQNTARRALQSDAFLVPFSSFFLIGAHKTPTNMDPKGTQMEPKGAEMKPQGPPKVLK